MATRAAHADSQARRNPIGVRFDAFELDEANAHLLRDGTAVPLAPTPFAVLCALVRQPGSLLTTNALLDEVWGHQYVTDSVLRTAISELRTALDDDARKPRFIATVSRRGYRFIAVPSAIPAAPGVRPNVSSVAAAHVSYFIGRAEPLSRLHRAWDIACTGKRVVVWIAGEPGIGKTTLIEQFIASLGDVACARGQCVEHYGTGEPYLPVLEALEERCRSDGEVPSMLRAVAPIWLLQLPWLGTTEEREALRRELAGVGPDRMLREMGQFLDRYTEHHPLLLVTEDLHWSDRATIQLIDYIARRRGSARLMWLASFRLAEVVALDHPLNPLRHELRLHDLCEEIVLDPFSESEVADYVAGRSPAIANDEAFVRALHERTDGMPLFVASMISEMSAPAAQGRGRVAPEQLAKIAVPENLAAIIEHYIGKLENEQRRVLSAAAVSASSSASTPSRRRSNGTPPGLAISSTSSRASSHGWSPRVRRNAATTQSCRIRSGTPCSAKCCTSARHPRRGHSFTGNGAALERERATRVLITAAELATHFERGGDAMTAVRYYAEAADAALARFSPEECIRIVERASPLLEQAPDRPERNALQITIGTLHGIAATRCLAWAAKRSIRSSERTRCSTKIRSIRSEGACCTDSVSCSPCVRICRGAPVADRAEALGSATNDPVLLSTACTVHGQVDQLQGRSAAARTWLERGLTLSEELDVGPGEFFVDPQVALLGLLAVPLLHLGSVEQARASLQRAYVRARDREWPNGAACRAVVQRAVRGPAQQRRARGHFADEMHALVDDFALAHGRTACRWFRGWADARQDNRATAIAAFERRTKTIPGSGCWREE